MAFLLRTSRKHGLSTEKFPVSAYVGSSKNLKDLKARPMAFLLRTSVHGGLMRSERKQLRSERKRPERVFYRTSSSVRLWWELKEPKGPKGCMTRAWTANGHAPDPAIVTLVPGWQSCLGRCCLPGHADLPSCPV